MIACDTSLFPPRTCFIYRYSQGSPVIGMISLFTFLYRDFFFFCVCVFVLVRVWCAWLDTYTGYTLESLSNFDIFDLWMIHYLSVSRIKKHNSGFELYTHQRGWYRCKYRIFIYTYILTY